MVQIDRSDSIQALRGIGFLAVFLYHAGIIYSGGGWGVSLFFLLSGFLLMVRNNENKFSVSTYKNLRYAVKKIGKLYPLHVFMTLVSLPLLIVKYVDSEHFIINVGFRTVINIFLIQSWFPWDSIRYSLNNLSWFLSCMLFFYFIFPVIHQTISRINIKRTIIFITGIVWILMVVYGWIICQICNIYEIDDSILKGLTYNFPLYRLGDFTVGCLMGRLYTECLVKKYSLKAYTFLELIIIFISLIIVLTNWEFVIYGKVFIGEGYWWGKTVAFMFPSITIIWLFMRAEGRITQLLRKSPLVNVGEISGEAYLIHEVVLRYIEIIMWKFFHIEINIFWTLIKMIAGFGITMVSVILWKWIKKEMIHFGKSGWSTI